MHCKQIPLELVHMICQVSSHHSLTVIQHVCGSWRYLALMELWRTVEISDWVCISRAQDIHAAYGKYVRSIQYRRHQRRRGYSNSDPTAIGGSTKTEILCNWFSMKWDHVDSVTVGSWPPYNVRRVQGSIANSCPKLAVLVLEGAASAWMDTLHRATATHPNLVGLHITEDTRALLPPAGDGYYSSFISPFDYLASNCGQTLTSLTIPCLALSIGQLLSQLPRLLPRLATLDLRQLDVGIAGNLYINIPRSLRELKISGHHPLSSRMFEERPDSSSRARTSSTDSLFAALSKRITLLQITGIRSEEAARREHDQFWSVAFKQVWTSLKKLVVPLSRPEFGELLSKSCPNLQYLRFLQAGGIISRRENDAWVGKLSRLSSLRYLDVASSNNEYEGCCLSTYLVSGFDWHTPWLHTLYLSRLVLNTDSLETLLCKLPFLHTLWFTFDSAEPEMRPDSSTKRKADLRVECRIRYLIIHAINSSSSQASDRSSSLAASSAIESRESREPVSPSISTLSLATMLSCLPSLNKCRLPMFTFPDEDRRWLQCQFPEIEFKRYSPPY